MKNNIFLNIGIIINSLIVILVIPSIILTEQGLFSMDIQMLVTSLFIVGMLNLFTRAKEEDTNRERLFKKLLIISVILSISILMISLCIIYINDNYMFVWLSVLPYSTYEIIKGVFVLGENE